MKSKRNVWRWLRWVLLAVAGLPILGLSLLVALVWLAPKEKPLARVPLPPPVLAPDSVLGQLRALMLPPAGPTHFLLVLTLADTIMVRLNQPPR